MEQQPSAVGFFVKTGELRIEHDDTYDSDGCGGSSVSSEDVEKLFIADLKPSTLYQAIGFWLLFVYTTVYCLDPENGMMLFVCTGAVVGAGACVRLFGSTIMWIRSRVQARGVEMGVGKYLLLYYAIPLLLLIVYCVLENKPMGSNFELYAKGVVQGLLVMATIVATVLMLHHLSGSAARLSKVFGKKNDDQIKLSPGQTLLLHFFESSFRWSVRVGIMVVTISLVSVLIGFGREVSWRTLSRQALTELIVGHALLVVLYGISMQRFVIPLLLLSNKPLLRRSVLTKTIETKPDVILCSLVPSIDSLHQPLLVV